MARNVLMPAMEFYKKDECHYGDGWEQWFAAATEVYQWAQTIVPGDVIACVMQDDKRSALLVFRNLEARAKVAAEYESCLLWKDAE